MNVAREETGPDEIFSTLSPPTLAPRVRRRWLWLVAALAAGLGIFFFLPGHGAKPTGGGKGAKAAKGDAAQRPVPVVTAQAEQKDVPVYLAGLGTAQAVNTVTVHSRVDGQLMRVAFHEGATVRQGELLAEIDPRPFQVQLQQAQGQLAKDQATLENARLDLERYRNLIADDSIPRQQLDTQTALVRQLEATLETDRGQIASARLNLTYSRVTAPVAGKVGLRLVDAGNVVHANDPNGIVVLTEVQPIAVLFTLPADDLPQVQQRQGQGAPLAAEAYDRELKVRLASGTLAAVDNQIDTTTGTVRLKALFPNTDATLFPNQFVNVRLLVDTLHGAVTVPSSAVQHSPQSAFVYVVGAGSKVAARDVEVGLTSGDETVLRRGVARGETVVVDGVDKLRPGLQVEARTVDGNGGSGGSGRNGGGRGASATSVAGASRKARR
jgi:multidrug efflux system membrane fusion protein